MKFDVVVGNPPYQDPNSPSRKLWVEISINSTRLNVANGITAMVTPNTWLTRPGGQKFKAIVKLFSEKQLLHVNTITPNIVFSIGEDIGYWILRNTPNVTDTTIVAKWDGDITTKRVKYDGCKIAFSAEDILRNNIIDKIMSSGPRMKFESEISSDMGVDKLIEQGIISEVKSSDHPYDFFWTASQQYYTSAVYIRRGVRLVLNRSGYYYKRDNLDKYMPIKTDIGVGIGGYGLSFDCIENARLARENLSLDAIRFFVESGKTSGFNTALTRLPSFDLSVAWTNDSLNEYFKLTDSEKMVVKNWVLSNTR